MNEPDQCCAKCKFLKQGECHRNPPFLMIIGSAYGKQAYKAVWPKIEDLFNWCGEYRVIDVLEIKPTTDPKLLQMFREINEE